MLAPRTAWPVELRVGSTVVRKGAKKMRMPNLSIVMLYLAVLVAGVAWAKAAENLGQMVNDTRSLRDKLLEDPYRPGHLLEGAIPSDVHLPERQGPLLGPRVQP